MDEYLTTKGRYGYIGFDITANSLHVGHFIPIAMMRLFQKHGHRPIILVGGGTTKIGDPSFKNTTRPVLSDDEISENMIGIRSCLLPFLKFGNSNSDAILVNNADWLDDLKYIQLLRDIGKYFSINRMIGFDSVKTKLEGNNSLSFSEFNYMILQAYDFLELYVKKECCIQFGGQDQWGNIVCGVELIRKKLGKEVFGFTNPLLTTNDGKKMGKTVSGAVWLRRDMISAYDFWQYWRNVDDADVIKLVYLFTEINTKEIKKMEKIRGQELNDIKKILADEITSIVHGRESLEDIHRSASSMFSNDGGDLSDMTSIPKYNIRKSEIVSKSVVDVLLEGGLCESRGEAKRLLRSGGIYVNNKAIDEEYKFPLNLECNEFIKLSCGKKKHLLILLDC
jgi:tyrosyl-tRNA synthetase